MTSTRDSYAAALDGLTFSDEAKARMTDRIAASSPACAQAPHPAKTGKGTEPAAARLFEIPVQKTDGDTGPSPDTARSSKPHHRLRRAVAAAAVVATLGLGTGSIAVATGVLPPPSDVLSDILGTAPAETELIDSIGRPIGASVSSNGVTVTADSVIGDRTNYTVVFTIARDDGRPFEGVTADEDGRLNLVAPGSSLRIDGVVAAGGGAYFYDADPTDNAVQYVEQVSAGTVDRASIIGRTARLSLGEIATRAEDGTVTPIASGDWDLKFKMNYADTSVELPTGQTVIFGDTTATIDGVAVSSLGIDVRYTVDGEMPSPAGSGRMTDAEQAERDRYLGLPIRVTFADGSVEDLTDVGTSIETAGGSTLITKAGQFGRVRPTGDIVSVTLGGMTIDVNG